MKKFLIIVIFMIPIIVVFALSMTSTILSMATPDNPTGIVIRDSFNKIVERESIINLDLKSYDEFIMIDILPLMTKEDGINEPEYDENNTGEVYLEKTLGTNRYKLVPKKIGIAKVIISAKANVNIRRAVTFNVKSESIETISVYAISQAFNASGECVAQEVISEISEGSYLQVTEATRFYADIYPIEALKDNQMRWRVVDGDSVEITANGEIQIRDRGLSQIRVSAKDKNMNYVVCDVIVDTSNAVVKSRNAFVEQGKASKLWVEMNLLLDPENSTLTEIGNLLYQLRHVDYLTQEETIFNIRLTEIEKEDWGFIDNLQKIYTNNGPYYLNAHYLLSQEIIEDLKVSSSDTSIAKIDPESNALLAQKAGNIIITATIDGVSKHMQIEVREKVPSIVLEYGAEDARLGIQLTRKWGTNWLDNNNEIVNSMDFGLHNKSNDYDVIWESSNTKAIEIVLKENSQDVTLNFKPESVGQSVTISAYLNINGRKYTYVKSSFTFNMLNESNYVNVDSFEQIKFLNFDEEYNICLQKEITAPETLNYNIGVSFYGNGFLYDSSPVSDEDFNYLFIGAINIFRDPNNWSGSSLKVQDGKQLNYCAAVERPVSFEEISFKNALTIEKSPNRGAAVFIYSWTADALISFKYVQSYNSEYGLGMKRIKNVLVEGCILGDNATYSLYSEWGNEREADFYSNGMRPQMIIKNCVFKHSDGPAICFLSNSDINPDDLRINYMPELYIEGFLDIYNWHSPDSFTNMFSKIIIRALSGSWGMTEQVAATMRKMLNSAFADYFRAPELSDLYYQYNGKKYVSVALLAMGAIYKPNIEKIHSSDPRLRVGQIVMVNSEGKPLTPFISAMENIVKSYINVDTIINPSAFLIYDSVDREPAIMPGQPVPNSYELYARLTGQSIDVYN